MSFQHINHVGQLSDLVADMFSQYGLGGAGRRDRGREVDICCCILFPLPSSLRYLWIYNKTFKFVFRMAKPHQPHGVNLMFNFDFIFRDEIIQILHSLFKSAFFILLSSEIVPCSIAISITFIFRGFLNKSCSCRSELYWVITLAHLVPVRFHQGGT